MFYYLKIPLALKCKKSMALYASTVTFTCVETLNEFFVCLISFFFIKNVRSIVRKHKRRFTLYVILAFVCVCLFACLFLHRNTVDFLVVWDCVTEIWLFCAPCNNKKRRLWNEFLSFILFIFLYLNTSFDIYRTLLQAFVNWHETGKTSLQASLVIMLCGS